MKIDWLESTIAVFSPKLAVKRAAHRNILEHQRKFEAAASGRRTENWRTSSTSADKEIYPALIKLRDRARDMARNNPHAQAALESLTTNVIGTGILPSPLVEVGKEKSRDVITSIWRGWADTIACDFDGMVNLYSLQELAARAVFESGEVLIRRRATSIKNAKGERQIPFSIQVLECDFIDASKDGDIPGGRIIQGKEYNKEGKCVAYWLFEQHPADASGANKSNRIPAKDVAHIYIRKRPGQSRGIPAGAAAMLRLRDLDEYEDAQLLKQKISACTVAFVHDSPDADITGDSGDEEEVDRLQPGRIEYLAPGKSVTYTDPKNPEGYGEYVRSVQRGVAAGYLVTYEAMTKDLSNVNFSSGRMGWLEFHRTVTSMQYNHFIPLMCDRVWGWFMDGAILAGLLSEKDRCRASWTPPRREMIDPVKEIKGLMDEVRGNFKSWRQAVSENGYDPDALMKELADEKKLFETHGLKPASKQEFDSEQVAVTKAMETTIRNVMAEEE